MKILIVDDDFVTRRKVELYCESYCDTNGGLTIRSNGRDALLTFFEEHQKGEPFELILLDVQMPIMDGLEALKKIRAAEEKKGIPKDEQVQVYMLTAYAEKDLVRECIQAGCNDYIVKPFDRLKLIEKLHPLAEALKEKNKGNIDQ
jgi:two-component system chemotaxis response regulator CheY